MGPPAQARPAAAGRLGAQAAQAAPLAEVALRRALQAGTSNTIIRASIASLTCHASLVLCTDEKTLALASGKKQTNKTFKTNEMNAQFGEYVKLSTHKDQHKFSDKPSAARSRQNTQTESHQD